MPQASCVSCKFFFAGNCFRYPPTLVAWPSDNQHPIMYMPVESRPQVGAKDWCGEYKEERML